MRAHVAFAALLVALVPPGAAAQSVRLTESEALAQLDAQNPRVRAALAGVDLARAEVLAAERWPNPQVTLNHEAVAGVAEQMVMVAQPLPITGRRGLEIRAASARVEATANRAGARLRRLRADLRLAFAALVAAQARERELSRSRDRLQALADVLTRREAAGEAAGFDYLRAQREVLEVETDRAAAATARAQRIPDPEVIAGTKSSDRRLRCRCAFWRRSGGRRDRT